MSLNFEVTVRSIHAGSPLFASLPPGDEALISASISGQVSEQTRRRYSALAYLLLYHRQACRIDVFVLFYVVAQ